ncbi:hypothetical protein B0E38_04755 [Streptomyces sp. 111WW2]|uniref:hypothetical protein n=1 Tax=Streptomyces sp. 111WW2 TaxID=1945515 RepID=UPI000D2BE690|nr:hypothetical protein [Streptomyces sp. 111WW2]PSK52429.1 hypothetical protein B0E38_04755 [Streptomyces sp. 111WW2]
MKNCTDRPLGLAQGVSGEHESKTAQVLAEVAKVLAGDRPTEAVDGVDFAVLVGTRSYEVAGRTCRGGGVSVSRTAMHMVGDIPAGVTREEFAVQVAEAAGALGYDWSADDNREVIPRHPVPGPRESDENGRVPAPRREQRTEDAR